ncbi:mRNA-capping enzyme subunit CEG1 [Acrasis kona]|uniref:mRNA-capping enzyme subunit CEG1 n=1 Tax=Acrasis kona TaxID=1008807 RepID=A0AAW2ZD57_9EUKA
MDKLCDALQFKRITDQWVGVIHLDKKFVHARVALDNVWNNKNQSDGSFGNDYLRKYIAKFMPNIVKKPNHYQNSNAEFSYIFPGPMAVQFNRKYMDKINDREYWITEKSDGVRSMMLNIYERGFPRWMNNGRALSLRDNCILESLVKAGGTPQVKLSDGKDYVLNFEKGVMRHQEQDYKISRHSGWTFSYFFDRNFEFYLSYQEFTFVTPQTVERWANFKPGSDTTVVMQDVVLVDGEIVFNIIENRYNYSIYDVVVCTCESPTEVDGRVQNQTQILSFVNKSMTARIEAMRNIVCSPHHFFHLKIARTSPPRLQIVPKRFYAKNKLEEVLSYIKQDPQKKHSYIYKGYNHNDGLVFTPDSGQEYPFAPGKNEHLLKWKWPDRLSCDFKAVYRYTQGSQDYYDLYFANREFDGLYRRAPLLMPDQKTATLSREAPNGIILECFLKANTGEWTVELIRHDKSNGNGFIVISSTLENMIENITTDDLNEVCMNLAKSDSEEHMIQLQDLFERTIVSNNATMHLRLSLNKRKNEINVQYSIQGTQQQWPEWPLYTVLSSCVWDKELDVENFALDAFEMRNERYLYVECIFVPHIGKYKIISLKGDEQRCCADQVLSSLETMVTTWFKIKDTHQRPSIDQGDAPPAKKPKTNV